MAYNCPIHALPIAFSLREYSTCSNSLPIFLRALAQVEVIDMALSLFTNI